MVYLLNDSYLPWCDLEELHYQGVEFKDILKKRLDIEFTKRLFQLVPLDLHDTLKYVLTLKFEEEPDYDRVIKDLTKMLNNDNDSSKSHPNKFDWNVSLAGKLAEQIEHESKYWAEGECTLSKVHPQRAEAQIQESMEFHIQIHNLTPAPGLPGNPNPNPILQGKKKVGENFSADRKQ